MTTEQPEALRLAEILEGDYCPDWFYEQGVDEVSAELRRQHTRIAELEAQLEAIGAGGVEPLRKISEQHAAGQEPVAYRYKDARGHWRYVGAPLTEGWDFPQSLNHETLFAAPQPSTAAQGGALSDDALILQLVDALGVATTPLAKDRKEVLRAISAGRARLEGKL